MSTRGLAAARLVGLVAACAGLALACSGSGSGDGEGAAAGSKAAAGEAVTTGSGLQITHLVVGDGASPKPTDVVRVHYEGTFPDGRVFDSSIQRGKPARFPLNRVIPCWTEALQLMKVGGKADIVCPPGIAYGASGAPPRIPPNATLNFHVELLGIE